MQVFLVHVRSSDLSVQEFEEDKAECAGLVDALGWSICGNLDAPLREPNPALLLGTGKAEEIRYAVAEAGAEVLMIDAALSPTQQRNWDRLVNIPTMDRQGLILEIFADRALSREAQLQVGLARMEYLLPRLANSYTELSRQRGGARGNRGQGETQIELDRRRIQDKIHRFKELLDEVRAQRGLTRKSRFAQKVRSLALVGYTNAGKSSLQRRLCNADTYVADALFATLDPSVRQLSLPSGQDLVLVDTVGFIRKLPHGLVEAFKATLEESVYSDVLLHVVDISNPWALQQYQASLEVLSEIGAAEKSSILVLNKIDQCADWEEKALWFRLRHKGEIVGVSAQNGTGVLALLDAIGNSLHVGSNEFVLNLGHADGKVLSWLYSQGTILDRQDTDTGPVLRLRLDTEQEARVRQGGYELTVKEEV